MLPVALTCNQDHSSTSDAACHTMQDGNELMPGLTGNSLMCCAMCLLAAKACLQAAGSTASWQQVSRVTLRQAVKVACASLSQAVQLEVDWQSCMKVWLRRDCVG